MWVLSLIEGEYYQICIKNLGPRYNLILSTTPDPQISMYLVKTSTCLYPLLRLLIKYLLNIYKKQSIVLSMPLRKTKYYILTANAKDIILFILGPLSLKILTFYVQKWHIFFMNYHLAQEF